MSTNPEKKVKLTGTVVFCSRRPKPRAVISDGGRYTTINFSTPVLVTKGQQISVQGTFRKDENGDSLPVLDEAEVVS